MSSDNTMAESEYKTILSKWLEDNSNAQFDRVEEYGDFKRELKYAGAVYADNGMIYGIPCSSDHILEINPKTKEYRRFGKFPEPNDRTFTMGMQSTIDGSVYGFLRTQNKLLKFKPGIEESIEIIEFEGVKTTAETSGQFYGGTLYKNTLYQAGRVENCIYAFDVSTNKFRKLSSKEYKPYYTYNTGILHPNGNIYFLPYSDSAAMKFDTKVMALNTQTEEIQFIGNPTVANAFSACVNSDGIIYGYSAGAKNIGILKITPETEDVRIVCPKSVENIPVNMCCGTKLGPNGKMYSVPAHSMHLFEFDPETQTTRIAHTFEITEPNSWKCAGSCVSEDGSIWMIPANGTKIYRVVFSGVTAPVPKELLCSPHFTSY